MGATGCCSHMCGCAGPLLAIIGPAADFSEHDNRCLHTQLMRFPLNGWSNSSLTTEERLSDHNAHIIRSTFVFCAGHACLGF